MAIILQNTPDYATIQQRHHIYRYRKNGGEIGANMMLAAQIVEGEMDRSDGEAISRIITLIRVGDPH